MLDESTTMVRNTSTLDDACIAAMCKLPLKHLSIEENSTVTSGIIDIILASQAAQTLIELDFCGVDAFTSAAGVLRLVRGCPKVIYLYWYASGERILTPLTDGNGQDVDELAELLGTHLLELRNLRLLRVITKVQVLDAALRAQLRGREFF